MSSQFIVACFYHNDFHLCNFTVFTIILTCGKYIQRNRIKNECIRALTALRAYSAASRDETLHTLNNKASLCFHQEPLTSFHRTKASLQWKTGNVSSMASQINPFRKLYFQEYRVFIQDIVACIYNMHVIALTDRLCLMILHIYQSS